MGDRFTAAVLQRNNQKNENISGCMDKVYLSTCAPICLWGRKRGFYSRRACATTLHTLLPFSLPSKRVCEYSVSPRLFIDNRNRITGFTGPGPLLKRIFRMKWQLDESRSYVYADTVAKSIPCAILRCSETSGTTVSKPSVFHISRV